MFLPLMPLVSAYPLGFKSHFGVDKATQSAMRGATFASQELHTLPEASAIRTAETFTSVIY